MKPRVAGTLCSGAGAIEAHVQFAEIAVANFGGGLALRSFLDWERVIGWCAIGADATTGAGTGADGRGTNGTGIGPGALMSEPLRARGRMVRMALVVVGVTGSSFVSGAKETFSCALGMAPSILKHVLARKGMGAMDGALTSLGGANLSSKSNVSCAKRAASTSSRPMLPRLLLLVSSIKERRE